MNDFNKTLIQCPKCGNWTPVRQRRCMYCGADLFESAAQSEESTCPEYTPEHITHLAPNEIFVFGSNLEGIHGGGAARYAYEHFGAEWGVGKGMTGHCYAIPTMHGREQEIKPYVDKFLDFAEQHPSYKFLVTPIGCGIAGFTPEQIAPLFYKAMFLRNIVLPWKFYDVLHNHKFKQCEKGHFYTGDRSCPICGSEEAFIPRCMYCGEPIRKSIPDVKWPIVGSISGGAYDHKVPWNYQWNGVCENCGHDFNIKMALDLEREGISRQTYIKVSGKSVPTRFLDLHVGFSGVEIEQNTNEGTTQMFISTNELRFLIKALKNSPILEQWDWREDWT